jgi:hypothetical protein
VRWFCTALHRGIGVSLIVAQFGTAQAVPIAGESILGVWLIKHQDAAKPVFQWQ